MALFLKSFKDLSAGCSLKYLANESNLYFQSTEIHRTNNFLLIFTKFHLSVVMVRALVFESFNFLEVHKNISKLKCEYSVFLPFCNFFLDAYEFSVVIQKSLKF
jgi:hypothetical protein